MINADQYTETDENDLTTGVISDVADTPFDFRTPKPIGQDIFAEHPQLKYSKTYDHNFVLNGTGLKEAATLYAEESGIRMNLEPLNITTDHQGNFLTTTRMAAEMTRLIGSPMLKVLYDVYHMQLNEGSLCDNIRAYGDQFGHIHVADAPGRHEPGTGEINYHKIFSCLEERGYTGLVGFELIPAETTAQAVNAIMQY